ncbi:nuclear transport factor 2 family protein [Nostoc sp.]|uniref:nuclear transport factor 2 family protein n=1 Tax=Nostoc sp. TaxID=1180 RepID=UPI002FF97AC8
MNEQFAEKNINTPETNLTTVVDPNLAATTIPDSVQDYLGIADALYRYGAGIDLNDAALFASAFSENAVVDFSAVARKLGLELPPLLIGGENIVQHIISVAGHHTTTHVVTNPRIRVEGDTAKMLALVEAMHLPPDDHSRHCLMKNRYDVDLIRDGKDWRICRLTIDTAWFTGDPQVLLSK